MAGFNLGDIFITFKTKGDDVKKFINDTKNNLSKFSTNVANSFKAAEAGSKMLLGTLTAAAAAAVVFGKKSVDAYFAAQEASTKLRTNMLNVKGATDLQVQSLEKLASKLQSVGVIEDDVIKAGMSQLATFNLQSSTIEKLTPKITDMVAQLKGHNATAEDMVAINNLVGKVMTGNVGALSRYGVTLDENQKKVLENGSETERAAMLTQVLSQNYGKVNEELRKTPQGRITGLKNAFGDLQEGVGEFIVEGLAPLLDGFSNWVSDVEKAGGFMAYFKKLIDDNQGSVAALVGALLFGLLPAIVAIGVALWGALAPLLPFIAIGAALGLLFNFLAEKMGGWGVVIKTAQDAWDNFMKVIQPLVDFFNAQVKPALDIIIAAMGDLITKGINELILAFQKLQPWIDEHKEELKMLGTVIALFLLAPIIFVTTAFLLAGLAIAAVVAGIGMAINWLVDVAKVAWDWWNKSLTDLGNWFNQAKENIKNSLQNISNFFNDMGNNANNTINNIINWFGSLPGRISGAIGALADILTSPFRSAFNAISGFWNSTVGQLNFKAPDWVPGMGGKGWSMPKLPRLAMGTPNWPGGFALLGENGPEAAFLPRGTQVMPSDQTRRAMASGGDTYNLYLDGIMARSRSDLRDIGEQIVEAIDERRRAQGKPQIARV